MQSSVAIYYNRYRDKITFEHIGNEVFMKGGTWFRYGYDDENKITMVDPSGGPYISIEDNLNEFWPKGKYQDLFIESIEFANNADDDNNSNTVIFKLKQDGKGGNN